VTHELVDTGGHRPRRAVALPYLRLLLRFDNEVFLHAVELAFNGLQVPEWTGVGEFLWLSAASFAGKGPHWC